MYRFSNNFSNAKLVLVRRHITEGSCSALIIVRSQPPLAVSSRYYATPLKHQTATIPDCPTPPRPPSRKLFYGVVGATILTGAAVVYAKNSPDARNWLESNAPWANEFVALVYQENNTYWKFSLNQFNKISTSLSHFMFGKPGVTPMDIKTRAEQDVDVDAANELKNKAYELPPKEIEPLYVEETIITPPEIETPATLVQTDKCSPAAPLVVHVTRDLVQLEQDMHVNTKLAVDNYKRATQHCRHYNTALFKVVESSIHDLDKNNFSALASTCAEKDAHLQKARAACAKARCAIDTLERQIEAGVQAPPETVAVTRRYIRQFRADLAREEDAYRAEAEKCVLADKYWNKVEAARAAYKEELQALYPGIDLAARRLDPKGDTDLLLLYTLKQVQFLQSQLAELQTVRELQINRAIECHEEKAIIEAKVDTMIKAERIKREAEYQKKALAMQAEANKVLKEQLKKQIEIQMEIQQDKLNRKEKEVLARFGRRLSEEMTNERTQFKKELAAMAGRMKAIEQTLKARAKAEAEARRSQSLWAAAEALLAATRRDLAARAPVHNEIKALERAGKDDKLVVTVLKGIPAEVCAAGVATEKMLRDQFEKLETTAAQVALVGREGAALPVYFLSWLQSKLLFQKLAEIPADELHNLPTDFSRLDTFDILQRAKYHMRRGEVGSAVRYVNLLAGGARAAATPWLVAARRHLEVRQAAEAVMAHASVAGLLYL